jgi:hypothetical protein
MHHTNIHHRAPLAATALALLLACLGLAACGSSSGSTSTSTVAANSAAIAVNKTGSTTSSTPGTTTPSTTPTPGNPGTPGAPGAHGGGPGAGRFAAVRECLAKEGITLPKPTPGQRPGPGGNPGAQHSPFVLPKGMTRKQLSAAVAKCGGGLGTRRGHFFNNPAYRQALTAFAACMRQNGVNLPSPNGSGKEPIFSTKGINTASAQFKAAETKCQSALRSAFPRRAGAGAAGAGGA